MNKDLKVGDKVMLSKESKHYNDNTSSLKGEVTEVAKDYVAVDFGFKEGDCVLYYFYVPQDNDLIKIEESIMSTKEIIYGDHKFAKYATSETDIIVWHDCLGSLNLTFKEFSDKLSKGELPVGTTIAVVFSDGIIKSKNPVEPVKTVDPVWTWEDKNNKILPETGSLIVGKTTKIVYEVVKKNNDGFAIASTNEEGGITVGFYTKEEIVTCFEPLETPQQKYDRECQEFASKALSDLVQGKTQPFEIFQKFYKELKPFQEDKKTQE